MALKIPTPELVAVHWIKGVPGIPGNLVNTTVPNRSDDFAEHGFVQVQSGGGTRDIDTGMRNSNMLIGSWAYNAGSQKVPWGKANQLLELILEHAQEAPARVVELPAEYDNARVREVYPIGEPGRVPNNEDFARYSMTLVFVWTPVQK